jgi:hypothetical protein
MPQPKLSSLAALLGMVACASGEPPAGPAGGAAGGDETGGTSGGAGGSSGARGAGGGAGADAADGVDAALDAAGAPDAAATPADAATGGDGGLPPFSFFVTSLGAMRRLSKNENGFGGDLRYGEATGLAGADKICTEIAESVMPGAGAKGWRAFLSTVAGGPDGGPIHAVDRLGEGPWYDRLGRIVAMTKADLMNPRPRGAHPQIIDDLPNEHGIPNHKDGALDCTGNACPDNHDTLTGTGTDGRLYRMDKQYTCDDWTSSARAGRPHCGHSWPRRGSGIDWRSALNEGGCAPGVNLRETGGPNAPTVGAGGGYGGIYCFAMTP